MIAILILAAGASTRMRGRDKLLEDIDGIPLLRRQVERALSVCSAVYVTLPPVPHPRHDALEGLDVTRVPVPDAAQGMTASLSSGLRALPARAEAAMIVLADMPDITADDLKTMLRAVDLTSDTLIWRATTKDGTPGHPIVFRASLWPRLTALSGDAGGRAVVQAHQDRTKTIALPGHHARTDLDTPEAWAAWREKNAT